MATIAQIVTQIRQALFGKDVRENIAQGIEKCYTDVTTSSTLANTAAARGEAINAALEDNAHDLILIQNTQPDLEEKEFNRVWIKPESDEYIVPTIDDIATVVETKAYLGI